MTASMVPTVGFSWGSLLMFFAIFTGGETCSSTVYLTAETYEQYLTTPNYPVDYNSYEDKCWQLDTPWWAPSDNRILLQIEHFDFETGPTCQYDWLIIRDGGSFSSEVVKLCDCGLGRIVSSGSQLFLEFHSDGSVQETGFYAKYMVIRPGDEYYNESGNCWHPTSGCDEYGECGASGLPSYLIAIIAVTATLVVVIIVIVAAVCGARSRAKRRNAIHNTGTATTAASTTHTVAPPPTQNLPSQGHNTAVFTVYNTAYNPGYNTVTSYSTTPAYPPVYPGSSVGNSAQQYTPVPQPAPLVQQYPSYPQYAPSTQQQPRYPQPGVPAKQIPPRPPPSPTTEQLYGVAPPPRPTGALQ